MAWAWPEFSEKLKTDLNSILAWVWPDVPDEITDILAWVWPAFDAGLSSLLSSLIAWTWPSFSKPAWLDDLLDFKWPSFSKPAWLDALLSFQWPAIPIPDWLGGSSTNTSYNGTGGGSTGPILTAAAAPSSGQPVIVSVGPNYITNDVDVEQVAYRVAQRLAYGV